MGLAMSVRSVTLPALIVTFGLLVQAQGAYQRQRQPGRTGGVYKAQITPHWFHANTRFWYRNDLRSGGKELVVVDVERGSREAAFDRTKLAASLSKAAGANYSAERLPFDNIEFDD